MYLYRFDHHFRKDPLPEILRVPLEQAILRVKVLPLFENKEVGRVMANMLEPPAIEAVANAIARLQEVAALDSTQELTPLGWHLAGTKKNIVSSLLYSLYRLSVCNTND